MRTRFTHLPLALVLALALGLAATAAAQTTLDVWVYENVYAEDAPIVRAADAFMAEHPDITVNLIPTQYGSSSYLDKYIIAQQAGSGPDALMVDVAWSPQLAAMGATLPLDADMDAFFPGPVETVTVDGETHGLPFYTNALALFYNKTAFEAAGLPLPEAGWTWDEFLTAVETLSDGEMYGFGLQGGWGGTFEWYPWVWQSGGAFLADDFTRPAFNDPEALEAAQFFLNLVTNPEFVPEAAKTWKGWSELGAAFANEVIAMFEVGDWGISIVENMNPAFEWGVAPLPMNREQASLVGGANWIVNPNSDHPDAATAWISYATGPAVFEMMDGYNRIAARRGAAEEQAIVRDDPRMQVFVDALEYAHPRPPIPNWTPIDYDCIQPAFLKVILEGAEVEAAMAEAELCALSILNE